MMRFQLFTLSAIAASFSCLAVPFAKDDDQASREFDARGIGSSSAPPAALPRNVWVQFETAVLYRTRYGATMEIASRMTQAELENAQFSTLVGGASIVIQGDGQSNGNLRIELQQSMIGQDRKVVQVVDFGIQNPMDAPLTRLAPDKPSYIVVHPAGTVQISNDKILDTNGKGLATDIWSKNTMYNTFENGPLKFIANMLEDLGVAPSDDASEILNSAIGPDDERASTFVEISADNVPVQLVKYTLTTLTPANQDVWTFDVTDRANPMLVEQLRGGQAVDLGAPPPPKQGLFARFNGATKQFTDWADMSKCFAGTCFDSKPGSGYSTAPVSEFDDEAMSDEELDAQINAAMDDGDPGPSKPQLAPIQEDEIQPDEDCTEPGTCNGKGSADGEKLAVNGDANIAVVRSAGTFAAVTSFAKSALVVLGVGAAIEAVIFIILDIVLGQYKAAALGAATITLGLGASLLIGGPIGLIIGAAVATLFFFLPGLFESEKEPAPSDNKTQIIQFAFFGNRDHTGNEACNKKRVEAGLSPNCTVVYGPGILSSVFNWDIFDAIVFLIEYNQGHAISIPDIANAFQVKDYTKSTWGSNVTASIDCGSYSPPASGRSGPSKSEVSRRGVSRRAGGGMMTANMTRYTTSQPLEPPSKGYPCHKSGFSIQRPLINIPVINQTADKVYSRVIPAPGGDCKLLSDPSGGIHIAALGLTITGRAVAIACNLTAADMNETDVSPTLNLFNTKPSNDTNSTTYFGTQLIITNGTASDPKNVSVPLSSTSYVPSNSSRPDTGIETTDGSYNRAYEAPPPPSAFIPYNASNSVCLGSPTGSICLPNGTYAFLNGTFGFSTLGTSTLSLPYTSYLSFLLPGVFGTLNPDLGNFWAYSQGDEKVTDYELYQQNITILNPDFTDQMSELTTYMGGAPRNVPANTTFNIHVPDSSTPPGLCLHASTQFLGDTLCYGLGGGNLTGAILGKAQSLSFRGQASAWLYAASYGDLGGAFVSTDVDDLSDLPYGSNGNFKGKIVAMWIQPPE